MTISPHLSKALADLSAALDDALHYVDKCIAEKTTFNPDATVLLLAKDHMRLARFAAQDAPAQPSVEVVL